VDKLQGVLEAPEGIWKLRVDKQYFHLYAVPARTLQEALEYGIDYRCPWLLLDPDRIYPSG
jgi:hypothetical protein